MNSRYFLIISFSLFSCNDFQHKPQNKMDSQSNYFSNLSVGKKQTAQTLNLTQKKIVTPKLQITKFSNKDFESFKLDSTPVDRNKFWQISLCPTKSTYECKKFHDTLTFPSLLIPKKSGTYNLYARVCQKSPAAKGIQLSCEASQKIAPNIQIKYSSKKSSQKHQQHRRSNQALFHFSQDLYTYIQQSQQNILSQSSRIKSKDAPAIALINNIEKLGISGLSYLLIQKDFTQLISNYIVAQDFYPRFYKESSFKKETKKYRLEDDSFSFNKQNLVKALNSYLLVLDQKKDKDLHLFLKENTSTSTKEANILILSNIYKQIKVINILWDQQKKIWKNYFTKLENQIAYNNYSKAKRKLLKKYRSDNRTLRVHLESQIYTSQNLLITTNLQKKLESIRPKSLVKLVKELRQYQDTTMAKLELDPKPLREKSIWMLKDYKKLYKNINGTQFSSSLFSNKKTANPMVEHLNLSNLVGLHYEYIKNLIEI
jgi:hypothetical protein